MDLEDLDPGFTGTGEPYSAAKMPDEVGKPLLRLVESLARKYARWPGERNELRSAGQDGLWEAWRKFDPERGVPFEMFAAKLIKWRVLDKRRALLRDTTTANYGNNVVDSPNYGILTLWTKQGIHRLLSKPFGTFQT